MPLSSSNACWSWSCARSAALALVVVGSPACGKKATAPKADPAKVTARAERLARSAPNVGSVPACTDTDIVGLTLTQNTLLALAGHPIADDAEHAPWINPPELDAAAARALIDPATPLELRREAAAEFLAAPGYLVYRVDNLDAPLALGVKEPKIGTIGGRVLRHDNTGKAICFRVFNIQNSKERSDWAIQQSNRAVVDPAVSAALRTDLTTQYLAQVPRPGNPSPVGPAPLPPTRQH